MIVTMAGGLYMDCKQRHFTHVGAGSAAKMAPSMWKDQRVAVVIPAFNEAAKIELALRAVPTFVDHIIVVDDASADQTFALAAAFAGAGTKIEVLRHTHNRGVGAAIATGYARAHVLGVDAVAVMAGDGQMDPADLPGLLTAVTDGDADYAKGNRFAWAAGWRAMPFSRLMGNVALSWLTRFASGLHHIFDSQCGYTVANRRALDLILSGPVFPRYGYPNALLSRLGAAGLTVRDVPVRPVYGPTWRSGIRIHRVVLPITRLLIAGTWQRARRGFAGALKPSHQDIPSAPTAQTWLPRQEASRFEPRV